MATTQVQLNELASSVKNWEDFAGAKFYCSQPLLIAARLVHSDWGEDARVLNGITDTVFIPRNLANKTKC